MNNVYKEEEKVNISNFLEQVEKKLCLELGKEKHRFPSYNKLLSKFRNRRSVWEDRREVFTNEITEVANELCIARIILSDQKSVCKNLEYESSLKDTDKTIDFCSLMDDDRTIYCDVKTIHPCSQDDWKKYISTSKNGYFPKNVEVTLFKNGLGGEIWHNWYNSRGQMLEYTVELEKKIRNCSASKKTLFGMIFCSNGFDWELDHLEDFADFYRTGRHNPDDPFSKMEDHFIKEEDIKLLKNINGFCYLERKVPEIKIEKFVCPVRGPWF